MTSPCPSETSTPLIRWQEILLPFTSMEVREALKSMEMIINSDQPWNGKFSFAISSRKY